MSTRVTVAVDAMGGDRAPGEIVAGALQAADELGVEDAAALPSKAAVVQAIRQAQGSQEQPQEQPQRASTRESRTPTARRAAMLRRRRAQGRL